MAAGPDSIPTTPSVFTVSPSPTRSTRWRTASPSSSPRSAHHRGLGSRPCERRAIGSPRAGSPSGHELVIGGPDSRGRFVRKRSASSNISDSVAQTPVDARTPGRCSSPSTRRRRRRSVLCWPRAHRRRGRVGAFATECVYGTNGNTRRGIGTRNVVSPWCLCSSLSRQENTKSAMCAIVVNIFWPSICQSLPNGFAASGPRRRRCRPRFGEAEADHRAAVEHPWDDFACERLRAGDRESPEPPCR